jgi:coenzyme F420-reducing hydrogenase delta subunit
MEAGKTFEPKIVAFCCHYCAYAAADLAGSLRLQYPTNIRIVKIPCSGRLDALHVLDAFEDGADGVMVAGCLEGDCHFQTGNLHAKRRVHWLQGLLKEIGLDAERLQMCNMSSAMGGEFVEATTEMTERIKELGPSPLRKEEG